MSRVLSNECLICGGHMDVALQLPNLPLTGLYSKKGQDKSCKGVDQELLFCSKCSHGRLKNILDVEGIYNMGYSLRTSLSALAKSGTGLFLSYLEELFPNRVFDRILDFGCNDGYMLKLLKDKGKQLLGVDTIWKDREKEFKDDRIRMLGERIENINFKDFWDKSPDLILSRSTMEHIENPKALLEKLFLQTDEDTVFVFETPCFDALIENQWFHQVFHHHLQYYTVESFCALLRLLDYELINYKVLSNSWGSLMVAFKKAGKKSVSIPQNESTRYPKITVKDIQNSYKLFKQQMAVTTDVIKQVKQETWYGYGAAAMLPILGYHLDTDFSFLKAIFDDAPEKDGLGYINLPVRIKKPTDVDFSNINIFLTAIDNRRPILENLPKKNPRRIINPLSVI